VGAGPERGLTAGAVRPRTVLGLEREGLLATVVIGAVLLVLGVGLPVVDDLVPQPDAASAGTVVSLAPGVTFVPPADWSLERPAEESTAFLTRAGTTLAIGAGRATGSVQESFDRFRSDVESQAADIRWSADSATVTTASGIVGIQAPFVTEQLQGEIAVFVLGSTEVDALAFGPETTFSARLGEVRSTIESIDIGGRG
jgi:hypothetical protein